MPFAVTDESTQDTLERVADGLNAFNEANSEVGDWHQTVFVVREEGRFVGGVVVNVHWHWLHVDMLFVPVVSTRSFEVGAWGGSF